MAFRISNEPSVTKTICKKAFRTAAVRDQSGHSATGGASCSEARDIERSAQPVASRLRPYAKAAQKADPSDLGVLFEIDRTALGTIGQAIVKTESRGAANASSVSHNEMLRMLIVLIRPRCPCWIHELRM